MCLTQFIHSFLPDLAATIIGLIFGIPPALYVNRWINKINEGKKFKEERITLNTALGVIVDAIKENNMTVTNLISVIEQKMVRIYTIFNTSSWDVVKYNVMRYMNEPKLQSQIAQYFNLLLIIEETNKKYVDMSIGIMAALGGLEDKRDLYGNSLLDLSKKLINKGNELLVKLDSIIKKNEQIEQNTLKESLS